MSQLKNLRPDIFILVKTIKETHSVDIAIRKSQPSQHHHRESPENKQT